MSCLMTKLTKWPVRPAKTQISLGIRPVWSVFAVCMKKAWVLSYPLRAQQRLCSDWADAQAESSLGAHHFVGFVMRRLRWNVPTPIAKYLFERPLKVEKQNSYKTVTCGLCLFLSSGKIWWFNCRNGHNHRMTLGGREYYSICQNRLIRVHSVCDSACTFSFCITLITE